MAIPVSRIFPSFSCHRQFSPPCFVSSSIQFTLRVSIVPTLTIRNKRSELLRHGPIVVNSKLFSKHSDAEGYMSPEDPGGNEGDGLLPAPEPRRGVPVFVTLPLDSVSSDGRMTRPKAMLASLRALKVAGVEGIVIEVWWGIVEREGPGLYDWRGYAEIVDAAVKFGLKVRAIMSFHQCGRFPGDSWWISLPRWVLDEVEKEPNLSYTDRMGRRNRECLSLGCDMLPVLKGRSPIQTYSDFMRDFRSNFRRYLGVVITGIQIGMGPGGELRYPSFSPDTSMWSSKSTGEFQCYDKFMLASLKASARESGTPGWGEAGPSHETEFEPDNPNEINFFSKNGLWNSPYGRFFLGWYSRMLLNHGERICTEAEVIFYGTGINLYGKVAGIHWHYRSESHPAELTSGYYNTSMRNGYLPIVQMFSRHGVTLCCACFDLLDKMERKNNIYSSPEGFLNQIVYDAFSVNVPVSGENSLPNLDDASCSQIVKTSQICPDGCQKRSLSFNFVRMGKNMFGGENWRRFMQLVKELSNDGKNVYGCLDLERTRSHFSYHSSAQRLGRTLACC